MTRRWAAPGGAIVLLAAWLGPLPDAAGRSFAAHMLLHMAVVAVAAPLLAVGVAGRAADPVRHAPRLFAALPASFVELAVVWTWHAPVLHHLARAHAAAFAAEQATFLGAGLLLWLSAAGGAPGDRRSRAGAGTIALLLTSMHMTLLGALLALAPRPLYPHAGAGIAGLTPLADQHLGGAIMILVGGAVYLAGGVALGDRLVGRRVTAGGRR